MVRDYRTEEEKVSTELRELALLFFKRGGYTAEEAYALALSFLTISKNKFGKDIVEVVVKYTTSVDSEPESPRGAVKYFLKYWGENSNLDQSDTTAVLTILSKNNYAIEDFSRIETEVNNYILKNLVPESLKEDDSKVVKIVMARDPSVKDSCTGVFVKKDIVVCD